MVELALPGATLDIPIQIYSAVYPVTIEWNNLAHSPAQLETGNRVSTLDGKGSVTVTEGLTNVRLKFAGTIAGPKVFLLDQNFPNPFNPTTTIRYQIPAAERVRLVLYDLLGREIAVLVDGNQSEGPKSVTFDATNLPSGVYFYRLQAGKFVETRKMLIAK
jgi:hypothetical protein